MSYDIKKQNEDYINKKYIIDLINNHITNINNNINEDIINNYKNNNNIKFTMTFDILCNNIKKKITDNIDIIFEKPKNNLVFKYDDNVLNEIYNNYNNYNDYDYEKKCYNDYFYEYRNLVCNESINNYKYSLAKSNKIIHLDNSKDVVYINKIDQDILKIYGNDINKNIYYHKKKLSIINSNIKYLYINYSDIDTLYIINCPNLLYVSIGNINLNKLYIYQCPNILYLDGKGNNLTSLNLNALKHLVILDLRNNKLENFKIDQILNLKVLNVKNNSLDELNINNNLKILHCENNKNKLKVNNENLYVYTY